MSIDHFKRAENAWPLLVERVSEKGVPFTYKELCDRMGLHYRAAAWFLGVIQTFCHENDLPPLQAMVVSKKSQLPGHGYNASPIELDKHKEILDKVYLHDWKTVSFSK